jgi:hypothetical protein
VRTARSKHWQGWAEAENSARSEQPEQPHELLRLCVTKSIFFRQILPNADFVLKMYIEIICMQEMNPQHRFDGKRRSTRLRHWGITLNNPNERGPRHHGVHLFQKDSLAGLLGRDFEAAIGEGWLFHASILSSHGLERPDFAGFP